MNLLNEESTQLEVRQLRDSAIQHAGCSLLIPGLGQLAQRRYGAAAVQFGTVVAYLVGAAGLGGHRALLVGLLWNLWSVVDAYRHESD